jgi:hypothetical protein
MRENRTSGSMRGRRKRAATYRACVLLYQSPQLRNANFLVLSSATLNHSVTHRFCYRAKNMNWP